MEKKIQTLYVIASILLIVSSAAYFFDVPYSEYAFAASVVALLVQKLMVNGKSFKTTDFRKKRLLRLEFYSMAVLILATYSMITDKTYWIPLVLLYAVVVIFLSYRE